MCLRSSIAQICSLMTTPGAITALLYWPKFSITSYRMVNDLKKQGLVPSTIIDVGANTGQFAIASAKIFPFSSIYSFEPAPHCIAQLRRNVSSLPQIHVYPFAIGDSEGKVSLKINSDSRSSSVLPLGRVHRQHFPGAKESGAIPVKVTTLDLIFKDIFLEPPILIKLDVQGYEANVLKGSKGILSRVDCVILETSFKPLYDGETTFIDICKLMETSGFRFLRPVGWLASPDTGEILQIDAFFVRAE